MSIIHENEVEAHVAGNDPRVDWLLDHPRQVGHRRWGILMLYYRTGLSQHQIARVFGITRQTVSYEIQQAFKGLARRRGRRGRGRRRDRRKGKR